MQHLSDDGIAILEAKVAESLPALVAYLDDVTGVTESAELDDKDGMGRNTLHYRSLLHHAALSSQEVDSLLGVIQRGSIMDRAVACLRILRIPASRRPVNHALDFMGIAQRQLSNILVDHPVLMHNRITVQATHFGRTESGPIGIIIAQSPDAEFPRLSHGISVARLKRFGSHPCVRVGLMTIAPKPPGSDSSYQGVTVLGATVGVNSLYSRARMFTSIMELDAVRSTKKARSASFLSCRGKTETELQAAIINTLLSECGIEANSLTARGRTGTPDFVQALAGSSHPHQTWFLHQLENRLTRWATLDASEQPVAMRRLIDALVQLEPMALRHPYPNGATLDARALTSWLISAVLDTSKARSTAIGQRFKSMPAVDCDAAVAFIDRLHELEPTAPTEDIADRMQQAIGDQIGESAQRWLAALRVHAMRKTLTSSRTPPTPAAEAEAPARRRMSI